ncbi:Serine/threonine-protein phosphatase 5-like 2 [Homarus americanus]|uniref:Serine/threonine-protein phosphatase 5-like 2 n=1 Tax=Homarus americanus TaxID=6706 RepID=A0A8J5TVI6_HOMAM|nr:Serine/threonine-protein phosphatase 5-like 2 [Homarus americanus]
MLILQKAMRRRRQQLCGQSIDLNLCGLPSDQSSSLQRGLMTEGRFSVEVYFRIVWLQALVPDHFFMSRGTTSVTMNQMAVPREVKAKYTSQRPAFNEVYNWLPLCHCSTLGSCDFPLAGDATGNCSPRTTSPLGSNIRKTERNRQPPKKAVMERPEIQFARRH